MENLLLEYTVPEKVAEELAAYRRTEAENEIAPAWDRAPSYPVNMKVSPLRTSPDGSDDFPRYWGSYISDGGKKMRWEWLQLVAKSNTVDLALARWLSRRLQTTCLAVSAYDWADTYAYRFYKNGEMTSEFDREMEERPSYRIDTFLESIAVGYPIRDYKECGGPGWREVIVNPFADNS